MWGGGGGSADLLGGLETCSKKEGENDVRGKIKQRRRLQLRLEDPSVHNGIQNDPSIANYLFLTTERSESSQEQIQLAVFDRAERAFPSLLIPAAEPTGTTTGGSCLPLIILSSSLISICNF